ncbi:ficolin-2-like [Lucilia sericata]|uniref:ficolin-2-like n=1 Tax=Lucilia sericata TaxID=13632 RepID=UPI0018A86979|nr:ficolin-2-like [Lucilia sericata]
MLFIKCTTVSTLEFEKGSDVDSDSSLSETLNQLEVKMITIINDKMLLLEKNLQNLLSDKITQIDQMDEKIKSINQQLEKEINSSLKSHNMEEENMILINESKPAYNVNEVMCSKCNRNIYSLMVPEVSDKPLPAVCDLKTLDGGWTVIQRRRDGSENFNRNWIEYVEGFGDLNREFFIGLETLYALTSLGEPQELYIILEDFEGERKYARYGEFKVASNSTEYNLTVSDYSGDAGDSLSEHNGYKFSTYDRDNDNSTGNCAYKWKAGWWYHSCYNSNLNVFI